MRPHPGAHRPAFALLAAALALLAPASGSAQSGSQNGGKDASAPNWVQVKCERYTKAWQEALARRGRTGLGPAFLARHDAFLASGCTAPPDVCPRSAEELDMANMMVVAAMNAGTASTFPPFRCGRS